jgi:Zn-dependent protease with chaperone function
VNFFEHQEHARRLSGRLVALFALAVVAIVVALDLVVGLIYLFLFAGEAGLGLADVPARVYAWTSLITFAVIASGSLYRIARLARGGEAVAELVGASPVDPATRDPKERRLLHVVEEMAIASGTSMPRVYLMEREEGINAFAAGYEAGDAVVAVTRGALERLDRDELQGVVAHEFSHILHGDMRLNVRLLGVLNGILVIGGMGLAILRGLRMGRVRSSGRGGAQAVLVILLIGAALTLIGYAGVFCARLIKSAVARQREFLADASAVQYTRNPHGIAGALQKLFAGPGSLMLDRHAEDLSHMLFAEGFRSRMAGWMATHPPLEERIHRIDPSVDLERLSAMRLAGISSAAGPIGDAALSGLAAPLVPASTTPTQVVEQIGTPTPVQLRYARAFLHALPSWLHALLGRPAEAASVCYGIVLGTPQGPEAEVLHARAGAGVLAESTRVAESLTELGPRFRLPLLTLALPALKRLSEDERARFLEIMETMIQADRRVTLAEFVVAGILRQQLRERPRRRAQYLDLSALHTDCALVLSLLAQTSSRSPETRRAAYLSAMHGLGVEGAQLIPAGDIRLADVEHAIERLALAIPREKARIIEACAKVALADEKISVAEGELLRAVALALDCPLPPIVDEQALAKTGGAT